MATSVTNARLTWTPEYVDVLARGTERFGSSSCKQISEFMTTEGYPASSNQVKSKLQVTKNRKGSAWQASSVFKENLVVRDMYHSLKEIQIQLLKIRVLRPNNSGLDSPKSNFSSPRGHFSSPQGHFSSPRGHFRSPGGDLDSPGGDCDSPRRDCDSPRRDCDRPLRNFDSPKRLKLGMD